MRNEVLPVARMLGDRKLFDISQRRRGDEESHDFTKRFYKTGIASYGHVYNFDTKWRYLACRFASDWHKSFPKKL